MFMTVIKLLESFNLPEVNDLVDELLESDNLDIRMNIVDEILYELDINNIDYSDFEDDIKDLAIG